MSFQTFWGLFF